jgi:hypothetical protein
MLHAIASAFIGAVAFISSLFGGPATPAQHAEILYLATTTGPTLGAALPSGTAVFETSLQSRISSTDTSLTLVANSVRGGSALSGYNCFTVDEGRTDAEYLCGTVSGTSVTSLTRGIDPSTGTTSNSALKFAHRVGANVKITNYPLIQILRNQANGADTYPNPLRYAAGVVPSTVDDLTDKAYVDGIAFNGAGVIDASSVARGVVELATGAEAAASTASGSSGALALPASLATSTYNSATAANRLIVSGAGGKIDDNFIATSTLFATTSIAGGPIGGLGKNIQVFSSTGTTTFSVPTGVKKVEVEVQGPGGGGGGNDGGGGGGGGYALKVVDVSATTSVQVYVGPGGAAGTTGGNGAMGTWSTFGTNGFYLSASGGTGGTGSVGSGGAGGVGSGGDVNSSGSGGGTGAAATSLGIGGTGGASHYGGGGIGSFKSSGTQTGGAGSNYGGGGGGGVAVSGNSDGGAGAQGIVIVRW